MKDEERTIRDLAARLLAVAKGHEGGISKTDLRVKTGLTGEVFRQALADALKAGLVACKIQSKSGRPITGYRADK